METIRNFRPDRYFGFPTWLSLILQMIIVSAFITAILFGKEYGENQMQTISFYKLGFSFILVCLFFYLYKVLSTFSPVDEVTFDFDKKTVRITVWYFYVVKRTVVIDYQKLSYIHVMDAVLSGASKSIRLYDNGKIKVKLNSRNGWSKNQIEEIASIIVGFAPKQKIKNYFYW